MHAVEIDRFNPGGCRVVARARNSGSKGFDPLGTPDVVWPGSPVQPRPFAGRPLCFLFCCRYLGVHPNIISLEDLFISEHHDELYIVMELLDSDLHRIIQSSQALGDAHHRYFMYQLLKGVKVMRHRSSDSPSPESSGCCV